MRLVFLVEPFGENRLLRSIFGGDASLPVPEAAVLPGHELRSDDTGLRLAPVRQADAATPGWTMALSEPQRTRLDFWMAAIGAKALVARVACGSEKRIVDTFVLTAADAPRVWRATDWDGEWRDFMGEAVEEVMRHFGEREAERMPELLLGISYRALARARGAADRTPVRLRSGLGMGDVETLRLDLPYAAYFGVEEHHLRHRRFDGDMSAPVFRAAFTSGDAVTVLPFDPRAGTVLLIEQFRAGPFARRDPRPWCLETVAGRCDPLETPEGSARREAREEAGLDLGRLERIAGYYSTPGIMAEHITAFVGEADLSQAGGRHGLDAEGEDIRAMVVPLAEALTAVTTGEVNNAPLLISLLWLERNHARLAAEWVRSISVVGLQLDAKRVRR